MLFEIARKMKGYAGGFSLGEFASRARGQGLEVKLVSRTYIGTFERSLMVGDCDDKVRL